MNLNLRALAISFTSFTALIACHETSSPDAVTSDAGRTTVTTTATPDAASGDATSVDGGQADANASTDGASCDPAVAWPAMLSAQIIPGRTWANLDLNHNGAGLTSLSYAESVNCPLVLTPDDAGPGPGPTQMSGCWGSDADVCISAYEADHYLSQLVVSGGYSGIILMTSRSGGAWGSNHLYTLALGRLEKDGQPMNLDWGSNAPAVFNELYDAFIATYYRCLPPVADCVASGDCVVQAADTKGGASYGYFGIRPASFYASFASGGAVPSAFSTLLLNAEPADGGTTHIDVCATDAGEAGVTDGSSSG